MPQMQGAGISSKVKAQSSKSYRNQPLSAFGFRLSALMQRSRWGIFSGIRLEITVLIGYIFGARAVNSVVRVPSSHGGSHWFKSSTAYHT